MNTRNKGNRNQLKVIKHFDQLGWLVDKVEVGGKFAKSKDLFGLFDLVAIKDGIVKFIQVTTNRPHTHKKYQSFCDTWSHGCEQWVWYDRQGWKLFYYFPHLKRGVVDLRK